MIFFEDIEIGARVRLGTHHFTQHDIKRFATAFDPQRFHLDEAEAAKTHFGRLSASGWHTGAAFMRLFAGYMRSVTDDLAARGLPVARTGPSPGFTNLRWIKPVFVDDEITYHITWTAKRESRSRPQWGLVSMTANGDNQEGVAVFAFDGALFVERRG